MFSQFRASLIAVFIIGFALLSASAQAQDRFHLYLDVDNNPNTGCSEAFPNAPGTASGGEIRLTAVVDGQPPQVIDVIMESCSGGGTFGSGGVSIGGGYPVALNTGVDGADAIELSIAAGTVGIPSIRALGLQLAARSERGNEDVLLTRDGSPDGGPIVFGIPFSVPVAGLGGLVLLGGVVVLLGLRARRQLHRRALLSVGMLLWVGVAVAGGAFMADGDISEWGGTPSIATDPAGDVSGSDDAADLRALFVALDGNELFFRIDVTDLENLPPVANPQAVSTLEDQALVITLSGSDPNGDPLSFAITTGPTQGTLGPVTQLTPTSAQVTYTPNADYFGADSLVFIVNDGQVNSPPATVSITVDPVNDAPSFSAASPAAVNEDAGAQSLPFATFSPGPANEGGQTVLAYAVSNVTNAALFAAGPSVANDGTLSFTPAADANGSSDFTVTVQDSGGTANGGVDTSAPQTFTITVNPVNDAPSFSAGPNQTVLEDAGAQSVPGWATAISAGPPDEAGQTLNFQLTVTGSTGNLAFDAAPAVNATSGDLSFTATADTAGVATIDIVLMDDGGTANGGVDTSPAQTFTITVTGINDPPVFSAGPNQTVDEDAGAQTVPGWATGIDDGDGDVVQALTFMVSSDNAALFAAQPAVSPTGTLSYTPAADASGVANVSVFLMDDGGTANGGVDTSPTQMFTITVNPVNDPPVNAVPATRSGDEDTVIDFTGPNLISVADVDIAGGMLTVNLQTNSGLLIVTAAGGATVNLNGTVNVQVSGILADVNATLASLTYQGFTDYNGPDSLTVTSNDNGSTGAGGPQSDVDVVAITVNPINDPPVNTVPGTQMVTGMTLEFSTPNGNIISVFDVDANPGSLSVDLTVSTGTLSAVPTAGVMITGNGSNGVTLEGLQADINSAMEGLVYTPAGGGNVTLQVSTDDLGNTGAGGPMNDTDNITILVDSPPIVSGTVPAQGGIIASGGDVQIMFSELVDVVAFGVTIECMPSGITASQPSVTNVNGLTYAGFGLPGDSCMLTAVSTLITDVDAIDPPDQLDGNNDGDGIEGDVDNFVLNYSIDAAPMVTTTSPMNGAVVANTAVFQAVFSEPVDLAMGGFTLDCMGPVAVTPSGSGTNTLTFTPVAPLPNGASCTATLLAANITDVDSFDPPDNLPANVMISFQVDGAPIVITESPINASTQISTTTTVQLTFNESVDAAAGAITLNCGGPIAGTVSGSGSSTLTFTPSAPLPEGTACTATGVAAAITDSDAVDPPDNLGADHVLTFTTDAAPTVTSTVPANGALLQPPTGTITINFSEAVNFDTTANAANTSFDLECPAATPANFTVVTASPAASVVLDPDDLAVAGETCTLTIRAAGITDADAGDPPDNLAADVVVTIEYDDPAVAVDDAYSVTPHLLLSIGAGAPQGGGVLGNDTLGSAVITGFGPFGNCNLVVPNGTNAAASSNGGRVVLATDGSFSYGPPAGLVDNALPTPEDSFCYTLTGGSIGIVGLNIALTELVWFVDANYLGANGASDGTQQRPHTTLGAVAAVDTASDTIHLVSNPSAYTGGITLEASERLIGSGSGSDLATITGIMPVAGSAFPALGGMAPTITCAGTCLTLGSNNLLRGVVMGNPGAAGTAIDGAGFGTLTVAETTINANGRALNLSNGTLSGGFVDIDVSGGNSQGVNLSAVGGTWSVVNNLSIGNVSGTALNIVSTPAGGSATFTGGLTINKTAAGAGVNFNVNAAPINLGAVSVTTGAGPALTLDNSSGAITIASGTVSATGGSALNSSGSTLAVTLASASSTNSTTQGINLNNVTGSVNIGGGSVSGSTGTAFLAQGTLGSTSYSGSIAKTSAGRLVDVGAGGSGTVTLSGNLSCTGSCGTGGGNHGLRVTGRSAGVVTFSGATKTFNASGANPGISLTSNTGAVINFTNGGLAVTSTTGNAFEATGGGIINVAGNGNMLSNTSGIALNVLNTTIAATGLTFQSINSNGGVNGIVLNNTGTSGGLTVTGVGTTAGSGGTIQNKTGDGIRLESTQNHMLNHMNLTSTASNNGPGPCGNDVTGNTGCNAAINMLAVANVTLTGINISGGQQYGINGNGVSGINFTGLTVSGSGNEPEEDGIRFFNLSGSCRIRNTTVQNSFSNNVRIYNNAPTPLLMFIDEDVANTSRYLNALNDDGMRFEATNMANIAMNVFDTDFDSSDGDHIQAAIGDSAGMVLNFSNNTMIATNATVLGSGITLNSGGNFSGSMTFDVTGNTINGANAKAINVNQGTTTLDGGTGTISGNIINNLIGQTGQAESGGFGIDVVGNGAGTTTVRLQGNVVRQFMGDHGIRILHRDGTGRINATLNNNTVTQPEPLGFNGVLVQAGASSTLPDSGTICVDLDNNVFVGSGANGSATESDFRIRQRFSTTIEVPGYMGGLVLPFITPTNPMLGTASETTQAPGAFANSANGISCPTP